MNEKTDVQESTQNTQNKTERKGRGVNSFMVCLVMIMIAPALIAGVLAAFAGLGSPTLFVRNTVTLLLSAGLLCVALYRAVRERELLFDNRENLIRFVMGYVCCTILASLSAIMPEFTVPLAGMSLVAAFLSNVYCGIICAFIFSSIPFLIRPKSFEFFLFESFVSVMVVILVLAGRKERRKAAEPVLLFIFGYVTLYTALIVLKRFDLSPSVIINPLVGLSLNILIMIISIKMVARNIIFAYDDRYQGIVDPEYPLLIELKQTNKREYKRAIHTAYICDRLSDRLGFDRILMKGAGFYHRIGVLSKDYDDVAFATVFMLRHENFPEPLIRLLSEYGNERLEEVSAQTALLCIADSVINEVLNRMEKGEEDINYERLIDNEINRLIGARNGRLQKSDLKIQHLYKIRKYLKEEKLYYDFLR